MKSGEAGQGGGKGNTDRIVIDDHEVARIGPAGSKISGDADY